MSTIDIGNAGQAFAEELLKKQYIFIERNWRCRMGEIDIIYTTQSDLVFVEVKALVGLHPGFQPEDHLNFTKQRKLIQLSQVYLSSKRLTDYGYQIDLVAVDLDKSLNLVDIRHYPNIVEDI